ncbi:MAG: hypothetical protein RIT06_311 [Chloroflexota bacterium]|jgi:hypothetical protein
MSRDYTNAAVIDRLLQHYATDLREAEAVNLNGRHTPKNPSRRDRTRALTLALFRPHIVLYAKELSQYQLSIYRSYRSIGKYRIAVVTQALRTGLPTEPGLRSPVIDHDGQHPESLLASIPELGVVLYMSHSVTNLALLKFMPHVAHAFSGHGDSDKFSSASRIQRLFDYIIVADLHARDRYAAAYIEIPDNRFLVIGGSPISGVNTADGVMPPRRLLLAPTWEGHDENRNFSSGKDVLDAVAAASQNGIEIAYRPHPATREIHLPLLRATKLADTIGNKAAQFNWSDAILTDISGILSEYLITGKPIIIPVSHESAWKRDHLEAAGLSEYCYVWDVDTHPLNEFLANITDDPLRAARLKRSESIYGADRSEEGLVGRFDAAISLILADQARLRAERPSFANAQAALDRRFLLDPLEPELKQIVESVRNGEIVLRYPLTLLQRLRYALFRIARSVAVSRPVLRQALRRISD